MLRLRSALAMATLVMLAAFQPLRAQQLTSPATLRDVVADIAQFRSWVLRDSTPLDLCDLPDAFDRQGRVDSVAGDTPVRYRTREACQSATTGAQGVRVRTLTWRGDTLIVEGSTKRGSHGFLERYRYLQLDDPAHLRRRCCRLIDYTVHALIEN